MKTASSILLSTVLLGGLLVSTTTTFADEVATYKSHGNIEFVPGEDKTDPNDPNDPKDPVKPIDPTDPNKPVDPGTSGPLTIDFASSFDFGQQKITSKSMTYYAAAQAFQKLGADGKAAGDVLYGPNYVQVTDNRGTEAGWTLYVTQADDFISTSNKPLTGAEITLKNANIVTTSQSAKPTPAAGDVALVPKTLTKVMGAKAGTGAGTYLNDWGNKAGITEVEENGKKVQKTDSISLSVPGNITKYAEVYTTQLNWSLTDVPDNI